MPSDVTLNYLHWVIQFSMGWSGSHLHSFSIQGVEYGIPMPEFGFDGMELQDERLVKLSKVILWEKSKFSYLYDFGDSWEHEILLEKVLEPEAGIAYPICIKAKRACPPEDCGGSWGYQELIERLQDPEHPDHEHMLEWIGGVFDPEDPEFDEITSRLKRIPKDTTHFEGYF
ncbi:plasmid pRiA4b ORF-3 family protein [Candidatus Synechococcus calcipolaris G9]|uniref:Plasmid pRiA4b ORF-3 family protein n=1 Tax=Candidatus Synechococcus calcipolaris G9 TaxID=1497997 RepID=A0ABT6F264_9SYNE|nr:plasmid pRiA4b ORF-3 family protein [Candidatus Synechococcus calcipolaris G9]